MSDDDQLLLFFYVFNWFTLIALVLLTEKKKQTIIIHLGVQLLYTLLSLYQMRYHSSGGAGLFVWFYWLFFVGLQWFSYLVQMGVIAWKRSKYS